MNILKAKQKANAGVYLTPAERAILKAFLGALIGFLAPILPYLNDIIEGNIKIDWVLVLHAGEMALIGAGIAALSKLIQTLSPSDQATGEALKKTADNLEEDAKTIEGEAAQEIVNSFNDLPTISTSAVRKTGNTPGTAKSTMIVPPWSKPTLPPESMPSSPQDPPPFNAL